MPRASGSSGEMETMLKSKPLSPERQSLAIAIAERNAAQAELDALNNAAGGWDNPARQAVRKAQAAVDAAPEAIAAARDAAANYLVAQASGIATPPPPTIAAAREAAQLAADELAAASAALETLQDRIKPAQDALGWKERAVEKAVEAVLRSSPEVTAVLAEVQRLQRELFKKGAQLVLLLSKNALDLQRVESPGRSDFSPAQRTVHKLTLQPPALWESGPDFPPADLTTWDRALAALHRDATAPLPTP
jgi:hypothetical protein